MKVLILGGTRFLGRHLAEAALRRSYEVTLFNRGKSEVRPRLDVETLCGDRNADLSALRNRQWDVVIDTSGYWPSQVRTAIGELSEHIGHYAFVSSCNVYSDFSKRNIGEEAEVLTLKPDVLADLDRPDADSDLRMKQYGALKNHCEAVLQEMMPARSLVVRPGLIVGPYDRSDRFAYWVRRLMRGGEVLAPGRGNRGIQLIDARDLSEWMLDLCAAAATGTFNTAGPNRGLTMGELLETCREVSGTEAEFTWVNDAFLQEQGVAVWSEMPLWIPEVAPGEAGDLGGFLSLANDRAVAAGLTFRSLRHTVQDTMRWLEEESPEAGGSLKEEREQELLKLWKSLRNNHSS
ncbi:NAD-dependent epimerase/dehydratase family protein [Paenibacillus thiaminolyticus]|uniref:NAD-dependent epimerase/dehydratase family protein n=1 Tax=Paenibacillus thiaminolyticus TaxID=49283 RepID=UPI0035A61833